MASLFRPEGSLLGILLKSDFNVIVSALQCSAGYSFLLNTYSTLVLLVLLAALKSSVKGSVRADKFSPSEEALSTAVCGHRAAGCGAWLFKNETSCVHKSHWTQRGLKGYRGGPCVVV